MRNSMRMVALLTAIEFASLLPASCATAAQPNVLLIISDDLRDSVGPYGNTQVRTPCMDAYASSAVRFDRAYAQYPVCNPSRSSFLTGLRPDQTGVLNNTTRLRAVSPNIVTMPQYLRHQGWYTASFGKVFHTVGNTDAIRAQWMDSAISWDETYYDTAERVPGPKIAGRNLTGGTLPWCWWASVDCKDEAMPDGQSALRAIQTMERVRDRPWFIAVGFHRPHDPFIAPQKYFDLYPLESLHLKRDPSDETPAPPLAIPGGITKKAFDAFTDKERLEFLRAYYAGVSFMDAQLGKVLAAVDRLGLRSKTLVIVMGDNGYHLGERAWWNKDTLFDRSCRVPFMVRPPGDSPTEANRVCTSPVELLNLFPTVLDYAGLPPPGHLEGESLRPMLEDPRKPGKGSATTVVVRRGGPKAARGRSVRTADWRYTQWTDGTEELYDERNDPEETHNQAGNPETAGLILHLRSLIVTGEATSPTGKVAPFGEVPRASAP